MLEPGSDDGFFTEIELEEAARQTFEFIYDKALWRINFSGPRAEDEPLAGGGKSRPGMLVNLSYYLPVVVWGAYPHSLFYPVGALSFLGLGVDLSWGQLVAEGVADVSLDPGVTGRFQSVHQSRRQLGPRLGVGRATDVTESLDYLRTVVERRHVGACGQNRTRVVS